LIKGLIVARTEGTLVYSYLKENVSNDYQILMSGFLASLQMFTKGMFVTSNSDMRAMTVATTRYTFKHLIIHGPAREQFEYIFVLLSDTDSKDESKLEDILEFLIVNFLGYERGGFISKLRIADASANSGFVAFNEFMSKFIDMGWNTALKKIKPQPSSILQGVLNELREYVPIGQIIALHPKISRIGPSYVWVSDDISPEEEDEINRNTEQALAKMFGMGMYESIVEDVKKRFNK